MADLKPGLPELPHRMRSLPIDERGYPIPWFVGNDPDTGKVDFRVIRPGGISIAIKHRTCWLCGEPLGVHLVFTIGPMCAINRVTSEPPSHLDCAHFGVKACPFLSNPEMRRSPRDLPAETQAPVGHHLDRNPGSTALWITRGFSLMRVTGGVLLRLAEPERVEWWAKGREASRAEIVESILGGLPHLRQAADMDGPGAHAALDDQIRAVYPLLPPGKEPDLQAKVLFPLTETGPL